MSTGYRYREGSISICKEWYSWIDGNPSDCLDDEELDDYNNQPFVATLPHQCVSWTIGGLREVEMLIKDLQIAAEKLKELGES